MNGAIPLLPHICLNVVGRGKNLPSRATIKSRWKKGTLYGQTDERCLNNSGQTSARKVALTT